MIEPSEGIPAHIALLLNENFPFSSMQKARKKLREMSRDLKDQAELAVPFNPASIHEGIPSRLKVVMSGGLDLFGGRGACMAFPCRINYAEQIARSIALTADEVSIHDFVGDRISSLGRLKNADVDALLLDICILKLLRPLIESKILTFSSPWFGICSGCHDYFERRTSAIAEELFEIYHADLNLRRHEDGTATIESSVLYTPDIFLSFASDQSERSDREIKLGLIAECVKDALHDAQHAAAIGGSVFSNSAVGLAGLMKEERIATKPSNFRFLEGYRAGQLPWVKGLTIDQTVQLRHEASTALPRFREFLARHLAAQPIDNTMKATSDSSFAAELREQAEEVRAELLVATSKSSSLTRNAIGIATVGVAVLSFANNSLSPAEGLLALLATLGTARQLAGPHEDHIAMAKAKPGYVLIAAQEILGHAK